MKFFPVTTGSNSKEIKRKKERKGKEKCDENDNTQKKFEHVRENCKAMVGLRKTKDGAWEIKRFYEGHSHELVTPRKLHLLRSNRQVSLPKNELLQALIKLI